MLDITERKAAEEQIAYLAYHDKLTGLPNRAMFDELLELALARARRNGLGVAVVSVDLDDFKLVNDSPRPRDRRRADRRCSPTASAKRRATPTSWPGPGGDEFLLLLADLDLTPPVPGGTDGALDRRRGRRGARAGGAARAVRDRRHRALRHREPGHQRVPARCRRRRGAAAATPTPRCSEQEVGPGGYVVHSGRRRRRDEPAVDVAPGSARRSRQKQWMLHYQPLIELDTGRMYGVEALDPLARAQRRTRAAGRVHPARRGDGADRGDRRLGRRGDLPPGRAVASRGPDAGDGVQPVPPAALAARRWSTRSCRAIVVAGMDPTRVTVEITESTAMTDPDRTRWICSRRSTTAGCNSRSTTSARATRRWRG